VGQELFDKLNEDMELLEVSQGEFIESDFLSGSISPMTFGSAKYSWGVDLFLSLFAKYSPPPSGRLTTDGNIVEATDDKFSGFVFKIQANMDRKHRDRVAFVRICSGRFDRGMKVKHARLGKEIRLAYANQFMAQDRETVDIAFSGDIVGVNDSGHFQIGDSISEGKSIEFEPMPRFSPEVFAKLTIKDPLKRKQLQKAVLQLSEEGTVQLFYDPFWGKQDPIIGVVGELQFDVLMFRLNDEYGLNVTLERQPLTVARWPVKNGGGSVGDSIHGGAKLYQDHADKPVVLLAKEWDLNWLQKENPDLEFKFTGA
jgi:peptide chain release factor 3